MKELKRGDFTGIYSKLDGKPLFYTGQYDYMECGGLPCVWLATDINNNLTYSRWGQHEITRHGWTIPPRPVEISKTARAIIEKAGAVIRWTTAEERRQANTDHKRRSPYILTTASGDYYTTGTVQDIRDILNAGKTSKKYGYFVRLYTVGAVDRAEIRTGSGLPYMDIPAAELDAVRENITRDTNGRATFTTTDDRTQPEAETETITEKETDAHTTHAEETAAAYIVQCKRPRGSWTDYSSPATLEECETIKARAEARRTCDVNGNLLQYRITHAEAPQTVTTDADGETPTAAHTEPPRATETATEAEETTSATEEAAQTEISTTGKI